MKFAIWAPVVKPNEMPRGSPSSSSSQAPATSSAAAAAGDMICIPAIWSHTTASVSTAIAASTDPPITQPK